MEPCALVEPQDDVVIDLLAKTDRIADIEAAIDLTLETVVRVRDECRRSETALWIAEKRKSSRFLPIYSRGLKRERLPYTYLRYNLEEQFYDSRKMLIEALWAGIPALRGGSDTQNLGARPNFGAVTVPSVFEGARWEVFTDVMPWISRHLSKDEVRRFAAGYDPSRLPERGVLPIALAHTRYFRDRLKGLDIGIGEVNNQGPFDIAHQVRGEDIFYDLYDDPPFVHELMELCTTAYVHVYRLIEEASGRTGRRDMPYCDDSSVLLSEPLFVEFSLPYLRKLGEQCESIGVHYCGKGHLDRHYFDCPAVKTINLGQPQLFDYKSYMERIVRAGKTYTGPWPPLPEEKSAEAYFRRLLGPLEKGKDNLRLSIEGYECGKSSAELCRLWYTLQGAEA
jgi:hypothetical protein